MGTGRVADDPLARFMNIFAGGQIHHRIAAPADRPGHFLHFFLNARTERGVADVGIDLHQKIAADDHRLGFRMVDVRRDDGAAAGHFVAHEFRSDMLGQKSAEIVPRVLAGQEFASFRNELFAALIFAYRDELHFRGNDAETSIVHLRHVCPWLCHSGGGASNQNAFPQA